MSAVDTAKPAPVRKPMLRRVAEEPARSPSPKIAESVFVPSDTVHARFLEDLEARRRGEVVPVATGLADLDRHFSGGFGPGELIVLAARPGRGKSALGAQIAGHVAQSQDVLFVSLEMSDVQVHRRRLVAASHGRLTIDLLKRPQEMTDVHQEILIEAANRLSRRLFLRVATESSIEALESQINAHVSLVGAPAFIVVDYLQLMSSTSTEHRALEVGAISRGLKRISLKLKIPVLALAQLNRDIEKRVNKRPLLSDLRESGSIEQDADAVLFLHSDIEEEAADMVAGPVRLIVAKARDAGRTDLGLYFVAKEFRFTGLGEGAGNECAAAETAGKPQDMVPPLLEKGRRAQSNVAAKLHVAPEVPNGLF